MNTQKTRSPFLFITLVLGVVAVLPATVPLTGYILAPSPSQSAIQESAKAHRPVFRTTRRAYKQAIDECVTKRAETGEDIDCPDINDFGSYKRIRDAINSLYQNRNMHESASGTRSQLNMSSLSTVERSRVRRYIQLGMCPEDEDTKVYWVCREQLKNRSEDSGSASDVPMGFLNDQLRIRQEQAENVPTFRDRLREIQRAKAKALLNNQQ